MVGITSPEVRKWLRKNLDRINKEHIHIEDYRVNLSDIDDFFVESRKHRKKSKAEALKYIDHDVSIANLLVFSIHSIATSFYDHEDKIGLFPKNWVSLKGKPDPNLTFSALFSQLNQHTISTIRLTQSGLDSSARVILRSVIELSSQISILMYFREDLKKYVEAGTDGEMRDVWYRIFAGKNIPKKLKVIDMWHYEDQKIVDFLNNRRQENHAYLSSTTHSGFLDTIFSTITWEMTDKYNLPSDNDRGQWSVLGGATSRTHETLYLLIQNVSQFLKVFFSLVQNFHGISLEGRYDDKFWKPALVAYDCAVELWIEEDKKMRALSQ